MDKIIAYIDGATRGNQFDKNIGAWGVYLKYEDKTKVLSGVIENTTNNICELSSAIQCLNSIKNKSIPIEVFSDSQYVVSGVNEWSKNWIKNGWKNSQNKPVENKGLWIWLLDLVSQFENITFSKCKGHSDDYLNRQADYICNQAMDEWEKAHGINSRNS